MTIDDRSTRHQHRSRAFSSRSGGTTDFLAAVTRKPSRSAPVYSSRARRARRRGFPSRESPRHSRGTRGMCSCVPNVFSRSRRVGEVYHSRFPDSPTAIRARRSSRRGFCWRAAVPFRTGRRRRRFMDMFRGPIARCSTRSTRSASPRRTRRRRWRRRRRFRRRSRRTMRSPTPSPTRGVAAFPFLQRKAFRTTKFRGRRKKRTRPSRRRRSSPRRGPRSPPAR